MRTTLSKMYDAVPTEIRPLVSERHILSSEDPRRYDALFDCLAKHFRPRTLMQWLDVKKLQDLIWEQQRLSRIKPGVIDSAQKRALSSLLLSMTNETRLDYTPSGNVTRAEESTIDWFSDSVAKKKLEEQLGRFSYSQDTIDAMAFVEQIDALLAVDKMQMSAEMQQAAIRARLEEECGVLQLHPVPENQIDDASVQPRLEYYDGNEAQEDIESGPDGDVQLAPGDAVQAELEKQDNPESEGDELKEQDNA